MGSVSRSSVPVRLPFGRVAALLALALLALPAAAGAVVSPTPDPLGVTINSNVNAVVPGSGPSAGLTFIGGTFSRVGVPTPEGVAIGLSTALPAAGVANPSGGIVDAVVSDGSGGWYIGGTFTAVGGIPRNRVAHILSTGAVDPNFDPNVNNQVKALALSADGGTLYAGGTFTTVNGATPDDRLAAFSTSTGTALTTFNPNVNSTVSALALSGATLYAGGSFTSVNGTAGDAGGAGTATPEANLAAFATATGLATSFNPNVTGSVSALAISGDGATLYAGGTFTSVNGTAGDAGGAGTATPESDLTSFTTATGVVTSFNPAANGPVAALALSPDGATLYAGGSFGSVNGSENGDTGDGSAVARAFVAAFTTTAGPDLGVATAFDPSLGTVATSVALSADGNTLYVAGKFTTANDDFVAGNGPVVRERIAAFDTKPADANYGGVTSFDPNMDNTVSAIALTATSLYAGGSFKFAGADTSFNGVAAIEADGTVDPSFNPDFSNPIVQNFVTTGSVDSLALSPDGGTLYVGGTFTTVNGGSTTYNNLAAVSTSTGDVDSAFNPNLQFPASQSPPEVLALTVSPDGGTLYAGGEFNEVNGSVGVGDLAAFTTTGPSAGTVVATFSPNLPAEAVYALALGDEELYAGGAFDGTGAASGNLLAVSPTTGALDTSFAPDVDGNGVVTLLLSGSTLYLGGPFDMVGTTTRNGVAAVSAATGTPTAFDANLGPTNGDPVDLGYPEALALALSPDGGTLYIGGSFTTVNATATGYSNLAAVDSGTGVVDPSFAPQMSDVVNGLATSGTVPGAHLYAGGNFKTVNGAAQTSYAQFTDAGTAPVFTADTPPATASVGTAYPSYTFAASGSPAPTFALASGALPGGLTLDSATGVLSGTPTAAGAFTFTVRASNGISPAATSGSITITVAGPQITGIVKNASGTPLANICVYLYKSGATGARTSDLGVCTGSAGTYTMRVAADGSYNVVFEDSTGAYTTQWYNGQASEATANPVTVAGAATTSGIGATLTKPATEVTGVVKNAGGTPLANICVYLYQSGPTGARTGDLGDCTNSAGVYTFGVAAGGSYNVVFEDWTGTYFTQWYSGQASEATANPITVTVGTTTTGIDATMTKPPTEISGTVRNASGTPLANVCVYLYHSGPTGTRTSDPGRCTNAAGTYAFGVAAGGSYNVVFEDLTGTYRAQWYSGQASEATANPVTVTSGATTTGVNATMTT